MYTKLVYMTILFALVGLLPIANAQQRSVTLYCSDAQLLKLAAEIGAGAIPSIISNSPDMPSNVREAFNQLNSTLPRINDKIQLACS